MFSRVRIWCQSISNFTFGGSWVMSHDHNKSTLISLDSAFLGKFSSKDKNKKKNLFVYQKRICM